MAEPSERYRKLIKYVPFFLTVIIICCCVIFMTGHDFDELLSYTPENLWLAAAVYPFWLASLINIIGLSVSFTIPYLVGRYSGGDFIDAVSEKYPNARKLIKYSHDNNFFTSYITRAVVFVPGDVVSMIHGAMKMPYRSYLLGSLVGVLPEMLVQTYVGAKLDSLDFRTVLVLLTLIVLTLAFSLLLNKKISRHGKEADKDEFGGFDVRS